MLIQAVASLPGLVKEIGAVGELQKFQHNSYTEVDQKIFSRCYLQQFPYFGNYECSITCYPDHQLNHQTLNEQIWVFYSRKNIQCWNPEALQQTDREGGYQMGLVVLLQTSLSVSSTGSRCAPLAETCWCLGRDPFFSFRMQ